MTLLIIFAFSYVIPDDRTEKHSYLVPTYSRLLPQKKAIASAKNAAASFNLQLNGLPN